MFAKQWGPRQFTFFCSAATAPKWERRACGGFRPTGDASFQISPGLCRLLFPPPRFSLPSGDSHRQRKVAGESRRTACAASQPCLEEQSQNKTKKLKKLLFFSSQSNFCLKMWLHYYDLLTSRGRCKSFAARVFRVPSSPAYCYFSTVADNKVRLYYVLSRCSDSPLHFPHFLNDA